MKEEIDPIIAAAAGYITQRQNVAGIMESYEYESMLSEGKGHTFDDIEHGDTVHYTTPQKQKQSGTAHIRGDGGSHWVLRNSSKSGGMGSIVTPDNFHSVTKRGKKMPSGAGALIYGPGGKKK